MSTPVTLTGRLTKAPELKFGKTAVARFTVVTDRRILNKDTNAWESVDSTFWDCVAFGQLAENIAESVDRGDLVLVTGNAKQESWEDKTGQKRTSMKVMAEEVAPSLRWATAKIAKAQRSVGDNSPRQPQGPQSNQPQNQQTGGWGSTPSEPPF